MDNSTRFKNLSQLKKYPSNTSEWSIVAWSGILNEIEDLRIKNKSGNLPAVDKETFKKVVLSFERADRFFLMAKNKDADEFLLQSCWDSVLEIYKSILDEYVSFYRREKYFK